MCAPFSPKSCSIFSCNIIHNIHMALDKSEELYKSIQLRIEFSCIRFCGSNSRGFAHRGKRCFVDGLPNDSKIEVSRSSSSSLKEHFSTSHSTASSANRWRMTVPSLVVAVREREYSLSRTATINKIVI